MADIRNLLLCSTVLATLCAVPAAAQTVSSAASAPTDQPETTATVVDPSEEAPAIDPAADDQAEPSPAAEDNTIVVTGSRAVTNGFAAPTPVTVVSGDQLLASAPNVIEGLRDIPQLSAGTTSARTPSRITGSGNTTVGGANLRNLGAGRTLVLIDGRRGALSGTSGLTDINLIPDVLVSRVDVVTGGASAAYGSDAVAGVVNFVLDTKLQGLKVDLNSGISSRGDGWLYSGKVAWGEGFAENRGHVILSASVYGQDAIDGYQRGWSTEFWSRLANPNASQPGQPQFLLRENTSTSNASFGGLITGPAALRGISFDAAGNPVPFAFGTPNNNTLMVGDAGARFPFPINAQTASQSLFGRVSFDVSDAIEVFAEGSYAHSKTAYEWILNSALGATPYTIFADNAFLPASIRQTMTTQNIPSFTLGKVMLGDGPIRNYADNNTYSVVAGFNAELGGSWDLEGYVQHSKYKLHFGNTNVSIRTHMYAAADAVVNPANNQVVCRVTLTNPGIEAAQGCVPINPFGTAALTDAQRAYVKGVMDDHSVANQDTAGLSVRGSPFSTWAGPVNVAAGVEYRGQEVSVTVDPISSRVVSGTGIRGFPTSLQGQLLSFNLTNVAQPSAGSFTVKEGFAEIAVPLAREIKGAYSLDLNAAARYTDYSTSGGVTTWKVGATYAPIRELRFRATRSRDIRAPNIAELYGLTSVVIQTLLDPTKNNLPISTARSVTGANPALTPEIADTLTAGLAFNWNGFGLSVDYYKIKIRDAITALTGQQILNGCQAGQADLCPLIVRDAGGNLFQINASLLNIQSIKMSGVDIETSYNKRFGNGQLSLRAVATHLDRYTLITPVSSIEQAGSGNANTGYNPRWVGTASVDYKTGPWSFFLQERFISSMARVTPPTTIDDNHIAATFYTNLRVGYRLDKLPGAPEIYASVDNLLDQEPRITETSGGAAGLWYVTTAQLYDTIGRFFTVGVRAKF